MTAFIDSPVVDEPDYQIQRSLRFRGGSTSYLARMTSQSSTEQKFTVSAWVKRGTLTTPVAQGLYETASDVNNYFVCGFATSDKIRVVGIAGGGGTFVIDLVTDAVFRDPTAWYHVVIAIDTTQATASNRAKIYVNSVSQTYTGTSPTLNGFALGSWYTRNIGRSPLVTNYLDGYLADLYFVDGQMLTPSSFGKFSVDTGQWIPRKYAGAHGLNGFYLAFTDVTSLTNLGYDSRTGAYSQNLSTVGTAIGGYTTNGGNVAAFDGDRAQATGVAARSGAPPAGYTAASAIGRDWGSGVSKIVTGFRIFGNTDGGMVGNTAATMLYKLQGSNDGTTYTDLTTAASTVGTASEIITVTSGINTATAFRYHRIIFNANGSDNLFIGELEFYEAGRRALGVNNWTANNISLTAGTNYDSMIDAPLGGGGNDRGNYATLNPIGSNSLDAGILTLRGNLDLQVTNNNSYRNCEATLRPNRLQGYYEVTQSVDTANFFLGLQLETVAPTLISPPQAGSYVLLPTGEVRNGTATFIASCTPTFNLGDTLMVAFDFTGGNRNLWFGRNGVWGNNVSGNIGNPAIGANPSMTSAQIAGDCRLFFAINTAGPTTTISANFGQRPFRYAQPLGFRKLHTGNLPSPPVRQPNKHFDTSIYAGTGITRSVTNAGFRPDLVWLKARSIAYNHYLTDSVRGSNVLLQSNLTSAEVSSTNVVTAFNSDGFSLGTDSVANQSAQTFVGWQWKAGGPAVTNTVGTITSQVSANPAAGFSVVTYPGNGISGATVGHGLGIAPGLIIQKRRNVDNAWRVWHKDLSTGRVLYLASTAAETLETAAFNGGGPTASTVVLGSGGDTNLGLGLLYCFAEIPGYSKIGSYTGNGSADGPFVFCGFRPRFLLIKRMGGAGTNWIIYDTYRDIHNDTGLELMANTSAAELDARPDLDILSTGFKLREANPEFNSSDTYIFYAVAETPFKYAPAR